VIAKKSCIFIIIIGEKQFFADLFINNWLYIGFDNKVKDNEIVDYLNKTGLFKTVDVTKIYRPNESPHNKNEHIRLFVNTKERKTCSQLKEIINMLEKSPIIVAADLAFCQTYYNCSVKMSYTNFIYVKVKDKDDLSDLYAVTQETNTWIDESRIDSAYPDLFYVVINKNSKGNVLQMANYFGETGKFALSIPCEVYSESTLYAD